MRKLWLVAVLFLVVAGCAENMPELHGAYRLVTEPHRFPVTLNFDSGSGQYWGTYINEYYGNYRQGKRHGLPTVFFETVNATRLKRPERLLKPEQAYFDFLYGEKMLTVTENELVIKNFRGDYLRFKAVE